MCDNRSILLQNTNDAEGGYEKATTPGGDILMFFGKHDDRSYDEMSKNPEYCRWCVFTATESPEAHWRPRRFVAWLKSLGGAATIEGLHQAPDN